MPIQENESPLRERKAAKIRIDLMQAMIGRLANHDFPLIRVEDLCADAMISKVTFFKYFPSKEDLLDLYFSYLVAYQNLSIRRDRLKGLAALRRVFENMALKLDENPLLMRRLFGYIVQQGGRRSTIKLNSVELAVLFPDEEQLGEIETISMGRVFTQHSESAFRLGEIKPVLGREEFIMLLSALFHGTGPSALRVETEHPGKYYIENFDNLVKIINQ